MIDIRGSCISCGIRRRNRSTNGLPNASALFCRSVVAFPRNDIQRKALRNCYPSFLITAKRRRQNVAPDHGIEGVVVGSIAPYTGDELIERINVVFPLECIPSQRGWQRGIANKETTTYDEVV